MPEINILYLISYNIKQSAHIRSLGVKLDPEITIEPQIADDANPRITTRGSTKSGSI